MAQKQTVSKENARDTVTEEAKTSEVPEDAKEAETETAQTDSIKEHLSQINENDLDES